MNVFSLHLAYKELPETTLDSRPLWNSQNIQPDASFCSRNFKSSSARKHHYMALSFIPPNNTFALCSSPIPIHLIPLIPSKSQLSSSTLHTPRNVQKVSPPKTHPPPGSHKYTWKKNCCPMGCRTVRPRSPSGFFLKRRSKSLPVIFCVPRRAIASRHSDSILQEESCLEMFTILKEMGTRIFEILKLEIIGFRFLDSTWIFSIPSTTDSHPPIPRSHPLILSGSCTGAPS